MVRRINDDLVHAAAAAHTGAGGVRLHEDQLDALAAKIAAHLRSGSEYGGENAGSMYPGPQYGGAGKPSIDDASKHGGEGSNMIGGATDTETGTTLISPNAPALDDPSKQGSG